MLKILLLSVLANNLLLICHVELEHNKKSQNTEDYIKPVPIVKYTISINFAFCIYFLHFAIVRL